MRASDFEGAPEAAAAGEALYLLDTIVRDLQTEGPLSAFVEHTRREAIEAMVSLYAATTTDGLETIRELQSRIRRFFELCHWVKTHMERGRMAFREQSAEEQAELIKILQREDGEDYVD